MKQVYLLLWFEAPMQSWGFDSKFGRRDTLAFPTRSGIMGLICCAMGAGGEQREWLAQMAQFSLVVVSYVRTRVSADGEPIKLPSEPTMRDFHMVGSGYDDNDPWQSLLVPKTSEGKKAVGGGAKMTFRYYLQDAAFAVVLEASESDAGLIAEKLQNPVWDLYLGRKSCAPTDLIYRGIYESEDIALAEAEAIAVEKQRKEDFRVVEGRHQGEQLTLNDVPVSFGERKEYRDRQVTVIRV